MGVYTKSTIHPSQILHIEEQYKVHKEELEELTLNNESEEESD
jgi:citrate lyase beta subunit